MILLDTMALLFFIEGETALPEALRAEIKNDSVVYVSAASIWEIGIKSRSGKLDFDGDEFDSRKLNELTEICREQGFTLLPITEAHACSAPFLPGTHKDPFDRMIVAQALERNAVLLSNDRKLDSLSPDLRRRWDEVKRKPPKRV